MVYYKILPLSKLSSMSWHIITFLVLKHLKLKSLYKTWKKKKVEIFRIFTFHQCQLPHKQEKNEGVVHTVQVSQVCLNGMTLNITMKKQQVFIDGMTEHYHEKTTSFYNCILMVRAWVWVLTIVELIANCLVSICFEMYICA